MTSCLSAWPRKRKVAKEVKSAAVLGAGIMGGGIAYQSAAKGTPILRRMSARTVDLGMSEARKLLNKKVSRGSLSAEGMIEALSNITPTLITVVLTRLILWSRRWSKILTLKSQLGSWSNWYGMTPSYRPTPLRFRWMICRAFWASGKLLRDALF